MRNWDWKEKLERFWTSLFQGLSLSANERLAIDIGAANTRIYLPGEGVVINEPSVIALDTAHDKVAALAQLPGLAEHLNQELGLHVRVASDPTLAATLGAGRLLERESRVSTHKSMKEQESAGW